ncbi:MAG: S8 family serine peptidase [Bacteroidia bacterium]|nr:S8 family serine peptidase [Bacteroidia bacterium]
MGGGNFLIINDLRKNQLKIEHEAIEYQLPVYKIDDTPLLVNGEIILRPLPGISPQQIIQFADDQIEFVKAGIYKNLYFKIKSGVDVFAISNKIYESGLVEWCHPDMVLPVETSNDPLYPQQYYLNNTGQNSGTNNIDINAPEAWAITTGCDQIRVAVLDDGVEDHEDLAGRVLGGFTPTNPVNGNGRPEGVNIVDQSGNCVGRVGHGIACAGILGASHNNSIGIRGVAPNAQIVPVNIFTPARTAGSIAEGINWAWNPAMGNADILSNSWNYVIPPGTIQPIEIDVISTAIADAMALGRLRNGVRLGCVVVFSSGNYNPRNGCIAPPPSRGCFNGIPFRQGCLV